MRRLLIAAVVIGAGLFAPPTSAQIGLGLSIPEVAVRQRPSGGGGGGCAGTGIFDLSNVCNDVYFIGALK